MLLPSALDMNEVGFLQVDLVRYPRAVEIPVKHPIVSLIRFVPEEERMCTLQRNSDTNLIWILSMNSLLTTEKKIIDLPHTIFREMC